MDPNKLNTVATELGIKARKRLEGMGYNVDQNYLIPYFDEAIHNEISKKRQED